MAETEPRAARWGQWQRSEGGERWGEGGWVVMLRAVGAEGVWAHIGLRMRGVTQAV